jgi:hypothetical protein
VNHKYKFIVATAVTFIALEASAEVIAIDQATVRAAGGFPFTISRPGSYKLTGNLNVPAGPNGIVIQASNVSLNLNGFVITCAGGQGTGLVSDGDTVFTNLTVKNGNISGCWSGLNFNTAGYATIEGITVSNYGVVGMQIQNGVIRRSSTTGGSDPNSIGMGLVTGTFESNVVLGDSIGLRAFGLGLALVTGNVVIARNQSLSGGNPTNYIWGNNVFTQQASDHTSQHNNLCGADTPC